MAPHWDADWIRLTGRTSGKCCDLRTGSRWGFWCWSKGVYPWEQWGQQGSDTWRPPPHGSPKTRGRPDGLQRRTTDYWRKWWSQPRPRCLEQQTRLSKAQHPLEGDEPRLKLQRIVRLLGWSRPRSQRENQGQEWRTLPRHYCVSQKKSPPYGFLKFFPKRLGIFNQFFTHLLYYHFYTRLQIFF